MKRTAVTLALPVLVGAGIGVILTWLLEWSGTGSAAVGIGVGVALGGLTVLVLRARAKTIRALLRFLDAGAGGVGKLFGWLVVVLTLEMTYDVVARHFFNAPTTWSFDLTYMLYGSIWMMGCAYALFMRRHIRIDIFYARLSPKGRGIIDVLGYLLLFFPVGIALLIGAIDRAQLSWASREVYISPWYPPAYPFKTLFPVAMGLLLLQGVSELVRSLVLVIKGEQL